VRDYHMPLRTLDGQQKVIAWSSIRRQGNQGADEEIIGFGRDITESSQAERRLWHRLAVEEALAQVSRWFVSSGEVDMVGVLRLLANVMGANRAYVFRIDANGSIHNIFEAADSRMQLPSRRLQGLGPYQLPHLMPSLLANEDVVVEDVSRPPESVQAAQEAMEAHGVRALAIVPIRSTDSEFLGFLGLDDTQHRHAWPPEDLSSLRVVAGMIATYWKRTATEEQLLEERAGLAERVAERTEALLAANIELARAARLKDDTSCARR